VKIAHFKIPEEAEKDVKRLTAVFESYGILIPASDILLAWGTYSEKKGIEWDIIPEKDEDIYLNIIEYFEVQNW